LKTPQLAQKFLIEKGHIKVRYQFTDSTLSQNVKVGINVQGVDPQASSNTAETFDFGSLVEGHIYSATLTGSVINPDQIQVDFVRSITLSVPELESFELTQRDGKIYANYSIANADMSSVDLTVKGAIEKTFKALTQSKSKIEVGLAQPGNYLATLSGTAVSALGELPLQSTATLIIPHQDMRVNIVKNGQNLTLDWDAEGATRAETSISLHNPKNGFPSTDTSPIYHSSAIKGSWSWAGNFAGSYTAVFRAVVVYPNQTKTYTQELTENISLVQLKPLNQISFPDVQSHPMTMVYAGSSRKVKVPGVNAARMESIRWLAGYGITVGSGIEKNSHRATFKPQDSVNRGAMAQFLQKLAGFTDPQIQTKYQNAGSKLTDISELRSGKKMNLARYYAILWLADTGITVGCNADGTKFCPNALVNRGAMAQFMQKFAGLADMPAANSNFPDVAVNTVKVKYAGSKKAVTVQALNQARIGSINWLASTGITIGSGTVNGKSSFRPQDAVTRGAMAQFMHKLAYQLGATAVRPQ
jgi:hypothetical protein